MSTIAEAYKRAIEADPVYRARLDECLVANSPWLARLRIQVETDSHLAEYGRRAIAAAKDDMYEVRWGAFWPGYQYTPDPATRPTAPAPAPAPAPAAPRCECGSNEPNCHSDWCPLHTKDGR